MLKFGKKLNYRPLLISLGLAIIFGSIGLILSPVAAGIIGIGVFVVCFFVYYLRSVPVIFQYWEADQDSLRYSDLTHIGHRLFLMLFPFKNHLKVIKTTDIDSITIKGKLDSLTEIPNAIPYSGYLAIMSPAISISQNPVDLIVKLVDGTTVDLSVARDYVYDPKKAIRQLKKLFATLENTNIHFKNIDQ